MCRTLLNRRARRGRIRVGSRSAEVRRQRRQPGLAERRLDHVEQRPDRPRRQPRIRLPVDAGGRGDGPVDEPARKRELDVRAHAVGAARRGAEHGRQPLRQPALDAARRHGDDLGLHRVVQRCADDAAERVDKAVRAFRSVDVKHSADRRKI